MLGESLTAFSASKLVHGGDGAIELAGEFVEAQRLGRIMRREDAGETLALLKRAVLSGGESVEHRKARVALQVIKTGGASHRQYQRLAESPDLGPRHRLGEPTAHLQSLARCSDRPHPGGPMCLSS